MISHAYILTTIVNNGMEMVITPIQIQDSGCIIVHWEEVRKCDRMGAQEHQFYW